MVALEGNTSGERAWTFPTDDDYEEDLKSDVADILQVNDKQQMENCTVKFNNNILFQCRQPTEADHIYAAIFLKKFVKESVPWIHLDIGSAYRFV